VNRVCLIVVRHGQTAWNAEGRFQGQLDSRLTSDGIGQAQGLARRLAQQRFSALYTSDLGRATATARIISAATGHTIVPDPRLRERHFGVFQGLTSEEIKAAYPDAYELHRKRDPDYVVPGGESLRQQVNRNISCLEELAVKHADESIVVVTHGGVLSALFRYVLSIGLDGPRRFEFPNSSLNVFTYGDGSWMLQTWGDTSHWNGAEK
jgi:probable phosphoglycerate mutase